MPVNQTHRTASVHTTHRLSSAVEMVARNIKISTEKFAHSVVILNHFQQSFSSLMKKSARRRRKHCALAVVRWSQKFCPVADPLPRGAGRPKFNQLEMVTTFTYKPGLVRIDARNFELSWQQSHKQTNKQTQPKPTDRTDYNTLRHG